MKSKMKSRTTGRPAPKAKKSYTLSLETVAFLEMMRKKRRAASVSSILEEIVQAARREQELASIERGVKEYYDSLSADEISEQSQWGDLALRNFPDEELV